MNTIKFTTSAIQQCKILLSNTSHSHVFFKVKGGGCNGLKYLLEPVSKNTYDFKDDIFEKHNDLNVVVCGKSLLYLIGTEIDFKTDFMGSSFRFTNPNATSKCGCGTTFSV